MPLKISNINLKIIPWDADCLAASTTEQRSSKEKENNFHWFAQPYHSSPRNLRSSRSDVSSVSLSMSESRVAVSYISQNRKFNLFICIRCTGRCVNCKASKE